MSAYLITSRRPSSCAPPLADLQDTFSNLSLAVPTDDATSSSRQTSAAAANADEGTDSDEADAGNGGADGQVPTTVLKGLREFLKPEQLRGDDKFMCDKCNGKHDAERGIRLRSMPPIISIHLKRFAIQTVTDKRGRSELSLVKVNTAVNFSRVLDMRSFVTVPEPGPSSAGAGESGQGGGESSGGAGTAAVFSAAASPEPASPSRVGAVIPTGGENGGGGDSGSVGSGSNEAGGSSDGPTVSRSGSLLYDLYAVLLHTGSLEKGHYFALIKDVADGSWYRFDDEKVTLLGDEELDRELRKAYGGRGSTSAYMLLYRELPLGTTVEGDTAHVPPDAQATPARSTEPAEQADGGKYPPSDGMAAPPSQTV